MPESNSNPASTPTGAAAKTPRKSPGPIDSKILAQLGKDHEIINNVIDEVGNDPQLAADLATHFIDADGTVAMTLDNLQSLGQEAEAAANTGAGAVSGTADLRDITAEERDNFSSATAAIRNVQKRAKEKYEEKHPDKLAAFYIGQPLASREQIRAAGAAIWNLIGNTDAAGATVTPKDTLPGLDPAKIAQIKTDLGQFTGIQTEQSAAQSTASAARDTFKDHAAQIQRRRRRVQQAIDAERPHNASTAGKDNTPSAAAPGYPTTKRLVNPAQPRNRRTNVRN